MADIAGFVGLIAVIFSAVIGFLGWSWLHLVWLAALGIVLYFQIKPAVWRHVERDGMSKTLVILAVSQAATFAVFFGLGRLAAWLFR